MAPLDVDWIVTAALAACLGWAGPKSSKAATSACMVLALAAWAASYAIMFLSPSFGGDTSAAEEYFNDFSPRNAAAELGVALVWTLVWFAIGRVPLLVLRRRRKRET